MQHPCIESAAALMEFLEEIGFLPLLRSNVQGYSAEEIVEPSCRFTSFTDGALNWPLWTWKGSIINESRCMYGKLFCKKAGYVTKEWWPDLCNLRRHLYPINPGSIEEAILTTLESAGSAITKDLRALCGFTGKGMRSKFDGYITNLEMGGYIITEDFVYPRNKQGEEYGFGLALLTTPEALYGPLCCKTSHTPQESFNLLISHFHKILPNAPEKQILQLILGTVSMVEKLKKPQTTDTQKAASGKIIGKNCCKKTEDIGNITIRKSRLQDVPEMQKVFAHAREFMAESGNPNQWTNGYPSNEFLFADITHGDSFVCLYNGKIVGTFVLRGGDDPTYDKIYNGSWPNNNPYATIHRIASNATIKGIFHHVIQFALKHYKTLRIDTHSDNKVMQHIVLQEGFKYYGIIHCWNGDERLAYQLDSL